MTTLSFFALTGDLLAPQLLCAPCHPVRDLTDRQTADAVRSRIDWKYLLSLDLGNPGFDFSVLSEFRSRVIAGHLEQRLLDRLLEHRANGIGSSDA